jgi:hypothetical protein
LLPAIGFALPWIAGAAFSIGAGPSVFYGVPPWIAAAQATIMHRLAVFAFLRSAITGGRYRIVLSRNMDGRGAFRVSSIRFNILISQRRRHQN